MSTGKKFYVCSESQSGRSWIVEAIESPDTPEECTGQYPVCNDDRAPNAHANVHIAYPFNGMGCRVESMHGDMVLAEIAEGKLWD